MLTTYVVNRMHHITVVFVFFPPNLAQTDLENYDSIKELNETQATYLRMVT